MARFLLIPGSMLVLVVLAAAASSAQDQVPAMAGQPPCAELLTRLMPAQAELEAANAALARYLDNYNLSTGSIQAELSRAAEELDAISTELNELSMLGAGTVAESAIQIELERQAVQQRFEVAQARVEALQQRIADASPSEATIEGFQRAVEAAFARYDEAVRAYQECIAR